MTGGDTMRYRKTDGQVLRGVPHLAVGLAAGWAACAYFIGGGPLTLFCGIGVTLIVAAGWWFILWPVSEITITGNVYTMRGKYGTTTIDLARVTSVSTKWIPFSGSWVVIKVPDNSIEIGSNRRNREELRVIGEIISETRPSLALDPRSSRALGLSTN